MLLLGGLLGCDDDALGELRRGRGRGVDGIPRTREDEPGPPLVAGGAAAAALQQVAEATCARRQRCGELVGELVVARQACVERLKMDLISDIHSESCATVDQPRLQRCLDAIAKERCGGVASSIRRAFRCRPGAFCSSSER